MAQYVKNDINYHGARNKTTTSNPRRQRQDSGTKKNQNYSANSNSSNAWNPPRTSNAAPPFNYDIWDSLPADPTPIDNAWEQNREVPGWSKRNRKFRTYSDNSSIQIQQEMPDWKDINSEFPPLENKPVVNVWEVRQKKFQAKKAMEPTDENEEEQNKPVVNVWEVRQKKFQAKKAMEPTDENEEERMIRQAMELSRIEATKDEQRRRELQEEYKMQMHLLELNPLDFEQFRTDEEIALTLSTMNKDVPVQEDFNYGSYFPEDGRSKKEFQKQNVLNQEESYTRDSKQEGLQNGKQKDFLLPKNNSKKSLHTSERTISDSANKKKITEVVKMFGGWGELKNSQKPVVESKEAAVANATTTLPAEDNSEKNQTTISKKKKTTKSEVPRNAIEEKNSEQDKKNKILKDVSERQQKSKVDICTSKDETNFDSSEDFGWQSDRDESAFGAKDKDEDWAWTSEYTVPSIQPENPIAMKTEEKHHSVAQKHSGIMPENPIAMKTEEMHHSVIQKHSIKPKSTSSNESGEFAKSIVSDYVNLAAKCESTSPKDDQSKKNLVCEKKPSTDENIFDILQKDFVEGTSHSQNSQTDPLNSAKHDHSLPNDPQAVDNSSKLQFTNPETSNTKNEISYSLKNVPHDASENSASNENGCNKLYGSGNSASQSPSLHSQNPDQMDDNDISLPLFSALHSNANNLSASGNSAAPINPPKPPFSDTFPESLGAHFQQFQMPHRNPMPPVFANPNFLNPSFMMGMNPLMMQQMLINPFFMQEMQAYYMSRNLPMGVGLPFIPQSMPGIPNFQPFMNLASNPPQNAESLLINPPIPPPNQRSDFTENNGMDPTQISSNLVLPEASPESDKWLEHYLLQEPQFNKGLLIPPPSMPQESAFDGNALNFPPAEIPAPGNFLADAYDTAQARSVPTKVDDSRWIDDDAAWLNDDWECKNDSSKSMRNSSRYVAERNKEIRQPATQPCFSRGFR